LLELLGQGGMGVVYKARQTRLKRDVALKMILSGPHATPIQLARFRAEAESVARLQHPNIVQIYEIGEYDGLPFFSLEYVDGGTLADKLRGTPLPARAAVRLIEMLARAMQYAHERGVVHRDLKPANILLEAPEGAQGPRAVSLEPFSSGVRHAPPPTPKIADFGLAKQMESSSQQTQSGSILGTPSYMAPEQARGITHEIGPPADIYALGAILYELLTGRPPFRAATVMETVNQVIGQEPVPPTRLQPSVPRDLETICLKCLQKEPYKRYFTAAALADDCAAFLKGEPIKARPIPLWERTAKWVRRRPLVAGLLVALVLVTVVGFGLVTWKWQEAESNARAEAQASAVALRERERAETNSLRAMGAVDSMLIQLAQEYQLADDPRTERKQRAWLREALKYYKEFLKERSDDPVVRQKTALASKHVGDILRLLKEEIAEARQAYGQAIVLFGDLTRAFPDNAAYRQALADSYNWHGELVRTTQLRAQAGDSFRQALALQERLVADFPSQPNYQRELARSQYNLAILELEANRPKEADNVFARAIGILEGLYRRFPDEPDYGHELARCEFNRGQALRALGRNLEAELAYREAVSLLRDLVAKNPRRRDYRRELIVAYNNAGFYYNQRPATPLLSATTIGLLADPQGRGAWLAVAGLPGGTPTPRMAQAAAEALHRQALAVARELVADSPDVPDYRSELATTHLNLGLVLAGRDRTAAAQEWEQARELLKRLVKERPDIPAYQGDLGMVQGNLGWVLLGQQKWAEAVQSLQEGVANARAALKSNPDNPNYLAALRDQYPQLARAFLGLKRPAEAAGAARALASIAGDRGRDYYIAARYLAGCAAEARADAAQSRGYADEAMRLLEQARAKGQVLSKSLGTEEAFAALRGRPDFQPLVTELRSPGKTSPR